MSLLSNLGKISIDKKSEQEKWEENKCKYIDVLLSSKEHFRETIHFHLDSHNKNCQNFTDFLWQEKCKRTA